jgi:hypothetical protein
VYDILKAALEKEKAQKDLGNMVGAVKKGKQITRVMSKMKSSGKYESDDQLDELSVPLMKRAYDKVSDVVDDPFVSTKKKAKHSKAGGKLFAKIYTKGKGFKESELDEGSQSIGVSIQMSAPDGKKYSVIKHTPKKSVRGRAKWEDISFHSSSEEATKAADEYAKKSGIRRMGEDMDEMARDTAFGVNKEMTSTAAAPKKKQMHLVSKEGKRLRSVDLAGNRDVDMKAHANLKDLANKGGHKVVIEGDEDWLDEATYVVKHDGVEADHPDADARRLFAGKKDVINHVTKYENSAVKTAKMLKSKKFNNVRIEHNGKIMEEAPVNVSGGVAGADAPLGKMIKRPTSIAKFRKMKEEK